MKKIIESIKKNFSTGLIAVIILGIFCFLLELILSQLKKMWDALYHLLPWQIQNKNLEWLVFFVSSIIIICLIGFLINIEYKGKNLTHLFNILFAQIPLVNLIFGFINRFQKIVKGIIKYKMPVYWHVPVVDTLHYGFVTNKTEIIKKYSNNKQEKLTRFTICFPTAPAPVTGNLSDPNPKDIWLITNWSVRELLGFFATIGADKPEVIISEPILVRYPNAEFKFEFEKNAKESR